MDSISPELSHFIKDIAVLCEAAEAAGVDKLIMAGAISNIGYKLFLDTCMDIGEARSLARLCVHRAYENCKKVYPDLPDTPHPDYYFPPPQ